MGAINITNYIIPFIATNQSLLTNKTLFSFNVVLNAINIPRD